MQGLSSMTTMTKATVTTSPFASATAMAADVHPPATVPDPTSGIAVTIQPQLLYTEFMDMQALLCVCFPPETRSPPGCGLDVCGPLTAIAMARDPATNELVGTASLYSAPDRDELWNVAVAPLHRGKGLCRLMLDMLKLHKPNPEAPTDLFVHAINPMLQGYRRMGFKVIGAHKPSESIHMRLCTTTDQGPTTVTPTKERPRLSCV